MSRRRVIAWIGLPGSGKTTAARAEQRSLAAVGIASALVGRDWIRGLLGLVPGATTPDDEHRVSAIQATLTAAVLEVGGVALVDDTNLRTDHRLHLKTLAQDLNAEFELRDLRTVPLATCQERNATRDGTARVPAHIITQMATTAGIT